jgi:hypothetical protein
MMKKVLDWDYTFARNLLKEIKVNSLLKVSLEKDPPLALVFLEKLKL